MKAFMKSLSIIKLLKKGLALGIITGLIVTFFDSLYMFLEKIYIPPDFPFSLIIANVLIWTCFGGVSALVFRLISGTKYYKSEHEPLYWVYFFIIPFAYLYGILGKIDIKKILSPTNDYYASFIWVTLIILFMCIFKKNIIARKKTPFSYLPEISAIVALYHIGGNLEQVPFIQKALKLLIGVEQYTTKEDWQQYSRYFTTISIVTPPILVFPCYALSFLKKTKNRLRFNGIVILGVVIVCWIGTAYLIKSSLQNKYALPEPPQTQTVKDHKSPNIFLIVLDTVRADRLSAYGACQTTPNLQKFTKDAVVYKNCIASSSWTGPSHASLFTGLYPVEHGYHHNIAEKGWSVRRNVFANNMTLADTLQKSGYQTYGLVSNYAVLHAGFGFDKGFHLYDTAKGVGSLIHLKHQPLLPFLSYITHILPKYYLEYRTAGDLNRNIIATLENNNSEPFFMFCNYMEAHAPYSPPRPFNSQFSKSPVPLISKLMLPFTTVFENNYDSVQNFSLSQYDGEIAYLDLYLGRLFDFLKKKGLYDSALIVISSDHGELFGEHNLYTHNNLLYEGVIKVPLLIKHPYQKQTGLNTTLITLSDVFATILDISGVSAPENISGVSYGNNTGPAVAQFYKKSIGEHYAIYDGSYKFMYYEKNKQPELYNVKHDPEEKNNLYRSEASIAARLERKLHEWKKQHPPRSTPDTTRMPISEEMRDSLKALGYIQ